MLRDEGMLRGEEEARKEPVHNKKIIRQNHYLITIPHQEFDIAESSHLRQRVPEGAPDVAVH
jgi:hypothetical protein